MPLNDRRRRQYQGIDYALEGHEHDHTEQLDADSRLFYDPPTDYPMGESFMPSTDDTLTNSFANEWDAGIVRTIRFYDEVNDHIACHQELLHVNSDSPEFRYWRAGLADWSSFRVLLYGSFQTQNALEGTSGLPSSTNKFVTNNDARIANVEHTTNKGQADGYASLDGSGLVPDAQIPGGIARDSEVTSAINTHAGLSDPHTGYQLESEKGQNNGYAPLDSGGKVAASYLPSSVTGDVEYQGVWNASTNTPTLGNSGAGGVKGDLRKVSVAGTTSVDGVAEWAVGDWIIHNGTTWDKIDSTDQVASVDGRTGAVTLGDLYDAAGAASGAISTHVGQSDPHTQYQGESEKGNANGYASLDGSGLVPDAQIPSGVARDSEVTSAVSGKLDATDGRVLTQGENDAAQGTSGTPSNTNRFVTDADQRLQSSRAVQTIGAAGAIAVGTDEVIPVTATADRTGITVDAGSYAGQLISIVNRSAFSLTFNATEATSRVAGGGAVAPNSRSTLVWDADYGGAGVDRWVRLPIDAAAAIASLRTLGTGAQQALPGNHSSTTDARTPTTREWKCTFFYGGDLATQVGVGGDHLPNSGTPTITEVSIYVDTKPATQNVIVDINSVNLSTGAKTSLYTTQGNRPAITPAGNYRVNATLPDTTQPGVGSVLTCDIDQVGSGTTGANLVVVVRGTY